MYQNILLAILLIAVYIYMNNKSKVKQFKIQNDFLCICIGVFLGTISSFLSIGGGPVNVCLTKKFDQEERLVEHTLRHGRVMSKARTSDEYLGVIGWCAFDYNTHYDFGSGDRICYNGVMDMFRIPKMAAGIYKSQQDQEKGAILEPLTYWARGERNQGIVFPVYVYTNCDEIELRFNEKVIGKFSRNENTVDDNLKDLKYPPIKVYGNGGEWAAAWTGAEFIGYINGKIAIKKRFCVNPIVSDLNVSIDDTELNGNEYDATRVVVKAVDEEGNILPYVTGAIHYF